MILGRSPNLVIGFATALIGAAALFHLGGFDPTSEQTAGLLGLVGAAVALIANTASIQIAAGQAAAARKAAPKS